jgi:FixJ family two-component response regulator
MHTSMTATGSSPSDGDGIAIVPGPQVTLVDDDPAVLAALSRLLSSEGHEVRAYGSAETFLSEVQAGEPGCVVLDMSMPGLCGLDVQGALAQRGCQRPVIFLSGHADVPMCALAMKHGAFEFLTKPVDAAILLEAVAKALERDRVQRDKAARRGETDSRFASLTAREREVLNHVMAGRLNKQIAADLGTAEKTVKVHRARGMAKMHVRSVAELVRIVERAHPEDSDLAL